MEFATVFVQHYQYDPATMQGFARLACSNRSLLHQHKEDTLVSSIMQQDLSRRRLESSHKRLVIDYVHDHLDNVCHLEEKDQVLAAFKQNLATVAGPLNVRLNFQVDCPDCYRQHKRILDDFTASVGETSGTYDMQWSTKCINILRNLPYDCDQWGYFGPIGRAMVEAYHEGLGLWEDYDAIEVAVTKQDSAASFWAKFE